jgi:hypothetical protein
MRTAKEMESDENEVEEGKDLEEQFLMDGPTNPIVDLIDPHRINAKAPESIIESPQMGHPAQVIQNVGMEELVHLLQAFISPLALLACCHKNEVEVHTCRLVKAPHVNSIKIDMPIIEHLATDHYHSLVHGLLVLELQTIL